MPATATRRGDRLMLLFAAWRQEILDVPLPVLVDPATAVRIVRTARAEKVKNGRANGRSPA
ncbi:hypothetical protein [Amycolatopsis anabasis]|uniref:hypothetical protein n=1 Tax=Amycolatopsis anabasis TaxID=1840409 RepID=UPI00131B34D0|nr:hypothetical protein [Amycolatopsis anabasis]